MPLQYLLSFSAPTHTLLMFEHSKANELFSGFSSFAALCTSDKEQDHIVLAPEYLYGVAYSDGIYETSRIFSSSLLKCVCVSDSPEDFVYCTGIRRRSSVALGPCISHQLPGGACATGAWTTL